MGMQFDQWFKNVNLPMIICRDDKRMRVVYENRSAIRLLNPHNQTEAGFEYQDISITDLFHMEETLWEEFRLLLQKNHDVPVFRTMIHLNTGERKYVNLAANAITHRGERLLQFCIQDLQKVERESGISEAVEQISGIIYQSATTEESIRRVLAFAGEWTAVSRSYIFESIDENTTSNTYEWCAPGVCPALEQLKALPKAHYSYDAIIARGLAVTDDIRKLEPEDRQILEAQGIKALAIIPIMSHEGPLGYVGFDDCDQYRIWNQKEVQFLGSLADILSSLLVRRNTERGVEYGLKVLDVVTNNLDSMIIAMDIHTRRLLFTNNAFATMAGADAGALKNKTLPEALGDGCFGVLYRDPLDEMLDQDGRIRRRSYMWEYYNPENEKWYLMRSSVIKWVDGRDVMIQTATEFTKQKEHEAELEYVASIDMMTGTYNREWSRKLLEDILKESAVRRNNSLVFLDLDGLKRTNDIYGHSAGDKKILDTLECIRSGIRKSDVLCRWGGDEFLIIIRASVEQADRIVRKIREQMKQYNQDTGNIIKLSFSYGIVEIDSRLYGSVEELVGDADRKMYQNKQRIRR